MTCVSSCLTGFYQDAALKNCYTGPECTGLSLRKKADLPTDKCIALCSVVDYVDAVDSACRTNLECNGLGKSVENNTKVCTNPCPVAYPFATLGQCFATCQQIVQEKDNSCVSSCPELTTADGMYCSRVIQATFTSAEVVGTNNVKVSISLDFSQGSSAIQSISGLPTDLITSMCVLNSATNQSPICYTGSLSTQTVGDKLLVVSTFEVSSMDDYDMIEININDASYIIANGYRSQFSKGPILITGTIPSGLPKIPNSTNGTNSTTESAKSDPSIIPKTIAGIGAAAVATPFLLSSIIDSKAGSMLCFAAQTYLKLTLMTYMNFSLPDTQDSRTYYNSFKEFFDQYNEDLLDQMAGPQLIASMKKFVCRSKFEKLCFLESIDNFWLSNMLDILVLVAQALVLVCIIGVLKVLKKKQFTDKIKDNLKNVLFFAFLVDSSMGIWANLWINVAVTFFENPLLIFFKAIGLLTLAAGLAFFIIMLFPIPIKNNLLVRLKTSALKNFRNIYEEISSKGNVDKFMVILSIHDLVFSAVLMLSPVSGRYQTVFWAAVEISAVILVTINRKRFGNVALFVRQLITEAMFAAISTAMAATHFVEDASVLASVILYLSLVLVCCDMAFCVVYTICNLIKAWRKKISRSKSSVSPSVATIFTRHNQSEKHQEINSKAPNRMPNKKLMEVFSLDKNKISSRIPSSLLGKRIPSTIGPFKENDNNTSSMTLRPSISAAKFPRGTHSSNRSIHLSPILNTSTNPNQLTNRQPLF